MKKSLVNQVVVLALAALAAAFSDAGALACTRTVCFGKGDIVVTARSLDWMEDMHSNLWAFPRGMKRNGAAGKNSLTWVSKYGSIVTSGYDAGTADGLNEKGLAANVLYLVESDYGKGDGGKPAISIGAWAQYVLDNFATTKEVVSALSKEPFRVIAPTLPNGVPANLHLAVSDQSGDSAIFEYIGGTLKIHHDKSYQVMTNSPDFDQQLALNSYWQKLSGQTFLPGTHRAADRFARASFYINSIKESKDEDEAVAQSFSVIRSVSVPLGIATSGQPNISSTIWRVVADHKRLVYFFDSAMSPNVFWVKMADLDLKEGAPVKKLTLTEGKTYSGNAAGFFQKSKPFEFLPADQ
ncbi:MAG TPA: linear amide C-N hydrolase [Candidatus Obscuribacter sp.]|nr:linear amide C-N hydrolase [Candidatus Obscuribacter sp.]HMY54509.1 linear amide C-N hydrolase [Candidatus Obscuribacter sp.]HND06403.1 linear amide C-N hydrolase [Candidatus Obscuribacter sp.]